MLSKKALLLKPSPTLALANKARELAAKGHDVVSLTVGEPDWPTFEVANKAAHEAIEQGFTKYTAASGLLELRQEIAKQTSEELGVGYSANQCVVGTGAKYILYALLQMICDPGDEVIIPSPYWVSYPVMAELADAKVKYVHCGESENFKLTAEKLQSNITEKTKVLILCSPSNPTGLLYSKEELQKIAQVLEKNPKVIVLSDDIYNKLVFTSAKIDLLKTKDGLSIAPQLLNVAPQLKDQIVIVNGASKTYSMTGWRVGWALGPEKLMKATADFLSQSTSNLTSISQKAALAALTKGLPELKDSIVKLENKKNRMLSKFQTLKYFRTFPPEGAFYFWMQVSNCFGKKINFNGQDLVIKTSKDVASILLEKYFVATVPGDEFGAEGFQRLSFAASDADLDKAFARFQQFESDLH